MRPGSRRGAAWLVPEARGCAEDRAVFHHHHRSGTDFVGEHRPRFGQLTTQGHHLGLLGEDEPFLEFGEGPADVGIDAVLEGLADPVGARPLQHLQQLSGDPALFFDPSLRPAAVAVAWTGLVTTALNRFIETTTLGKLKTAEVSIILATDPLWASLFAALWLGEDFRANDYVGGALIVGACLATALTREDFSWLDNFSERIKREKERLLE